MDAEAVVRRWGSIDAAVLIVGYCRQMGFATVAARLRRCRGDRRRSRGLLPLIVEANGGGCGLLSVNLGWRGRWLVVDGLDSGRPLLSPRHPSHVAAIRCLLSEEALAGSHGC
ncbi:hypothetical protein ACLOJK_022825 [Asimina triloba]